MAQTTTRRRSRRSTEDQPDPIRQYVDDLMRERGGALNADDLRTFIHACTKRFLESALDGEMEFHLKNGKLEMTEEGLEEAEKNKRNGYGKKTVLTDTEQVEIEVPRDRNATFEPLAVPKRQRRIPGIDEKIISMYARGMSTREISAHIEEIYGIEVSADFISTVTDSVLEDIKEWQNRPLEECYPVVFFDAIRVKVRSGAGIKAMAAHLALGIRNDGSREVLGIWMAENEGAAFWGSVFTELKTRGVEDILIAVTDGLKGMTEAIEAVYPQTMHQTCIVHLIRNSTAFVSYKHLKSVTKELKNIYQAVNADAAYEALEAFETSELGQQYPTIAKAWKRAWPQVVPFFNFSPEIRRLIYTTNSIEALNRSIRKVIKTRSLFPTVDSAMKLLWLAIKNSTSEWERPVMRWSQAMGQFAILFGDRFIPPVR